MGGDGCGEMGVEWGGDGCGEVGGEWEGMGVVRWVWSGEGRPNWHKLLSHAMEVTAWDLKKSPIVHSNLVLSPLISCLMSKVAFSLQNGKTACHYAAEHGHLDILKLLYDYAPTVVPNIMVAKVNSLNIRSVVHCCHWQ